MLIVTRRPDCGEKSVLTVGDHIEVTLLSVEDDQVRLGIMAPANVKVHRKEVWLRRQEEVRQKGRR